MCDDLKRKLTDMDDVDENTIANKPWAQHLLSTCLEITKKAVLNWCNIVSKIGVADLHSNNNISIFIRHVEHGYEDLIMEVESSQQQILDKITKLFQQMHKLCKDLQFDIPSFSYEEISLSELHQNMLEKMKEYESLAEIRRKELKQLHHKQLDLCKRLGKKPKLLPESPLPNPNDVEKLRLKIDAMESEAMEREEKFFQLKEQITEIVNELEIPPSLDFEKEILTMDNTEVKITDLDMEQLNLYYSKLMKHSQSIKEEIFQLRVKVDDLWDKLETDIGERDSFRQKNTGNSLSILKALKEEVKKLEEMKKANIQVFISKQRQELAEIWEKCHCTEEDRRKFTFYHSECYNEDLFELHEREIQKWKDHYEENRDLFDLLEEHKKLWSDYRALDINSCGANRYKNRGGQLLVEEKLRNKLTKKIPKVEENLNKLAETYYGRKGKQFFTFGETVAQYIERVHEEREQDLKLKLSAKKQQREQQVSTIAGGRSRMNLFTPSVVSLNPTLTPRTCVKRKGITTPVTEPLKRMKTHTVGKNAKTGLPKLNVSRTRRRSGKGRLRLSFKASTSSSKENCTGSTSYQEFLKEVSTRTNCRSTGFLLKENTNVNTAAPSSDDNFLIPGVTALPNTPVKRTLRSRF